MKNTKSKIKSLLVLLAVGIFLGACGNKDRLTLEGLCADEVTLEAAYDLSPEAAEWFPYAGFNEVVFKNEFGTKANFKLAGVDTAYLTGNSFNGNCLENPVESIKYSYDRNTFFHYMENEAMDITLELIIARELFDLEQYYDKLDLHIRGMGSSMTGVMVVDSGNYTDGFSFPNAFDWLGDSTLLGRSFSDVYTIKNEEHTLYINKEYCVIGFTDIDQKLWVFDSMN